jgi:hypothetical protein
MSAMRTRTTTPSKTRSAARRTAHRAARPAPVATGEQRVRAAGGPQDVAHYSCECGTGFAGPVSTHVACPACGADQAW